MKKENGIKIYVNRLPQWFDLEDMVYRPLLLDILPKYVGYVTRFFGENRILTKLCSLIMKGISKLTAIFGENKLLTPISKFSVTASGLVSRAAADSVDVGTLLLRKTVFRDLTPEGKMQKKELEGDKALVVQRKAAIRKGIATATDRITSGFSFALLVASLGVCIILGILLYSYFK